MVNAIEKQAGLPHEQLPPDRLERAIEVVDETPHLFLTYASSQAAWQCGDACQDAETKPFQALISMMERKASRGPGELRVAFVSFSLFKMRSTLSPNVSGSSGVERLPKER